MMFSILFSKIGRRKTLPVGLWNKYRESIAPRRGIKVLVVFPQDQDDLILFVKTDTRLHAASDDEKRYASRRSPV
jgi:hypothetical protein